MLVEGQSEEIFVRRTLAPHLAHHGVYVEGPILLWTKRSSTGGGHRGGVSSWEQIYKSLRPLTRDSNAWITTLLDFYGLPRDFPGLQHVSASINAQNKVIALQEQFAAKISHQKFIPFLVLHELEAWLFSDPDRVEEHFGQESLGRKLRDVVQRAGGPELINQDKDTHPKERLRKQVSTYKETTDGPTLLEKIGIEAVRAACPHFAGWLNRLEKLGGA